jgi:hypothetical protein
VGAPAQASQAPVVPTTYLSPTTCVSERALGRASSGRLRDETKREEGTVGLIGCFLHISPTSVRLGGRLRCSAIVDGDFDARGRGLRCRNRG